MKNSNIIRVLFMQSQTYYGADSRIHGVLMQNLDRSRVEVHTALNYGGNGEKSAAALELEQIPDLHIRRTHFGVSTYNRPHNQILQDTIRGAAPAVFSLGTLPGYVRKNKIRIIHCTEKPRDAFFGYLLARLSGAKCIIHIHVKAEDWIDPKVQWAMRQADGLIGVSRFVADSIVAMGFPAERVFYAHNSLDIRAWDLETDGSQVRKEFGIGPDTALLLSLSRLFYWKGHSELLKALAIVKETTPDFKLLIVGDDDPRAHPGRGHYSDELKTLTRELDLSNHVIFTGFRSDVPCLFAASDLYTMPSFEEPFGMVFLEAMAMKKPVVALDNGGSREIITHGVDGLLSLPQDIEQLAKNIKVLIENPSLRFQMGKCGRRKVAEHFTPARLSEDMINIYQEVLEAEQPISAPSARKVIQ